MNNVNPDNSCEVVTLPSGDRAIKDIASGQIMHCGSGPSVEPREIYVVPSRLDERLRAEGDTLVLFDVGLGAGSNALAAWKVSESLPQGSRRLEIVSFDHELAAFELAVRPENLESFGFTSSEAIVAAQSVLKEGQYETNRTLWRFVLGDFLQKVDEEPEASADIVFWDMYSARTCPQMWTATAFQRLRRVCRDGATLHTTSASTAARAAMLLGGFAVGRSVGTGNRGETTIACTHHERLDLPLGARWLDRLSRTSASFPSDFENTVDVRAWAWKRIRELPQFVGNPVSEILNMDTKQAVR